MPIIQKEITLPQYKRGFHIITEIVTQELTELAQIEKGILQIFIKHTSASLTINENADPTVRQDMEDSFNIIAPENAAHYRHTFEGSDDMPAHIKASMLGCNLTIPITDGKLNLGTWQGIYLCEHRNFGGARKLVLTMMGE